MFRPIPLLFVLLVTTSLLAQDDAVERTRVFAPSDTRNDLRFGELKDLNGYFPMQVPRDLDAWTQRAKQIRRRILVSNGLWPMPPRPPVQPTIHGKVQRDDYTVEKVYFESHPGFYVTGNLYRPKGKSGPFPIVLSPYGHYTDGRFHDHGAEKVLTEISTDAEKFEVGGRHPLQARCVQLARMGCVVFHYDMVGYADSKQISYELAHRHSEPRPAMEDPDHWGLYTAQAEMRMQNVMGLQTFNSLRAVDFVVDLPDVDATRIGVTGSSGGGTQTMMLAALEPRVTVSFPAVMVSTAMQGGCTCENAACLRVGTGNIEFAGLFAPEPQGINAADDWTVELATKGLPELKQLYGLFGAEDLVEGYPLIQFPHNYNSHSRGKMYAWMNEYLKLGIEAEIVEQDYLPLSIEEMSVWNDEHPLPATGDEFEKAFLGQLSDMSDNLLAKLQPNNAADLAEYRRVVGGAFETILDTNWDAIEISERENIDREEMGGSWLFKAKLKTPTTELPIIFLYPKDWNQEVVVWASGYGKISVLNEIGEVREEAQHLLDNGFSIAAADLYQQGELRSQDDTPEATEVPDAIETTTDKASKTAAEAATESTANASTRDTPKSPERPTTRKVANERDFAGYTFGYNRTRFAQQVHDILTVVKFITEDEHPTKKIHLFGIEGAAPHAVLAKALAGDHVEKLAIDDGDFRFRDSVQSWRDPDFLPGAIKYGDLPGMLTLCAPSHVFWPTKQDHLPAFQLQTRVEVSDSAKPISKAVVWLTK